MQPLEIGVCSWSLHLPDLNETFDTIKNTLNLNVVQLGFLDDRHYRDADKVIAAVRASGLQLSGTAAGFAGEDYSSIQRIAETGGYIPDDDWEQRLAKTIAVADLTKELGIDKITVHVGFVPHDTAAPKYAVMVDRLKHICDQLGQRGLTLIMETGQEKAELLMGFLDAIGRENIGINFDMANMILYGVGHPLDAIDMIKDKIMHVHAKDGTWSDQPGKKWGQEVVLGTGDSDIPKLVSKLRAIGYAGPLVIEREVGDPPTRLADIKEAIKLLKSLVGTYNIMNDGCR